ncbi:hypothetical protein BDQ17DRAFT_1359409, partial [Cyathus striatus]
MLCNTRKTCSHCNILFISTSLLIVRPPVIFIYFVLLVLPLESVLFTGFHLTSIHYRYSISIL